MEEQSSGLPNPYTQVIDLTSKAQRERRNERAKDEFPEPDPPLPPASPETMPETVQQALKAAGWTSMMPVQERAIPYILDRRDLIVQSRTGSGKTGAFLLPLFELLDPERDETQALILTPTRELARQINEEFERMKAGTPETFELRSVLVYGGVGYGPQIKGFKEGAQVVIGTPGRILDHLERRNFTLDSLRVFILDEADEMLSMGFFPAMQTLKRYLPTERLSYMFSATMPPKVRQLGRDFLREPGFLALSAGQISVDTIEHRYYRVDPMEKDRALVRLIEMENPDSAIIFANTKREVEYLTKFLGNYGHQVDEISGDLTQKAREAAMDRIREGNLRFLVATDVAARGIDITDLSHVFQYDIPEDPEYYIHRTGRTARAGKAGVAIAFTTRDDEHRLQSIARRYGIELVKREIPEPDDVSARVAQRMVVHLEERMRKKSNLERERLQRFIPVVQELVREEPELLAMLIDELYHEHIHEQETPEDAAPRLSEDERRLKKPPRRDGGRGRGRRR
ncbi:MAG: DEAD/DEAH box helicase [Rhodothermales bacterium]|nr:DEAD/DEAH box helicase [Rhodothermales bacterium]